MRGKLFYWFTALLYLGIATSAKAHEIRPAYLEIRQLSDSSYSIVWKVPTLQNRIPKINPIFPSDFDLQKSGETILQTAYLQRYTGAYKAKLSGQSIRIDGLENTLIDVLVQIYLLEDLSYTLMLQPDRPLGRIPVEPNFWQVARLYLLLGIEHILLGIDHLLFVLGLLLLVQRTATLIKTITAFTLAHSITLVLSALKLVQLPSAPVEAVIALSILFLAKEYMDSKYGKPSLTAQYPWVVAFIFGLLHGFGFAGALAEIGLPQRELLTALLTFNIGVELGQLLFILALIILRWILVKLPITWPSWSWKLLPYALGSIASFWLIERVLGFW